MNVVDLADFCLVRQEVLKRGMFDRKNPP